MRRTQNIPRTRSREKMQMQLRQALKRTAGWESLARYTLGFFPEELLSWCVKVDTLGRLCDNDLERSYNSFTTTNIYFIGAAYNSYFLIIYKPSSLIISSWTLARNWELAQYGFVCPSVQFPFAPF